MHLEDSEVVYVIQVFTDGLLCVTVGIDTLEDKVTSGSAIEFADCMSGQGELTLIPLDCNALVIDIEIMLARIIVKVSSVSGVKE